MQMFVSDRKCGSLTWGLVTVVLLAAVANAGGEERERLLALGGAAGDSFGLSLALSGNLAVVGAPDDDDQGTSAGSAHVFDLGSGQELFQLVAADGAAFDRFGLAVATDGAHVVVGAPGDGDSGPSSGSAYVFDAGTGQELVKLLPADGVTADSFGWSVAVDAGVVAVGAIGDDPLGASSGSAYLFDAATGQELAKLVPSDGADNEFFGAAVTFGDSVVAVGSVLARNASGLAAGAVYLFDIGTGQELAKLVAGDGQAFAAFGSSLGISADTLVVGAQSDSGTLPQAGAAYLFDVQSGQEIAKLTPRDPGSLDYFGASVAISGSLALVGAYLDDERGSDSGSAYLFDTATGQQVAKLAASDGAAGDLLGIRVALSGSQALLGAPGGDDQGTDSGVAYVYDALPVLAATSVRNGGGSNALILTGVSDPVLGTTWDTDLDTSGHGASIAALEVRSLPFSGLFLAGGELLVDVTSPQITSANQLHSGNVVRFSIPVPDDLFLCGLTASAQGLVLGAPGFELSNALDLIVGF